MPYLVHQDHGCWMLTAASSKLVRDLNGICLWHGILKQDLQEQKNQIAVLTKLETDLGIVPLLLVSFLNINKVI